MQTSAHNIIPSSISTVLTVFNRFITADIHFKDDRGIRYEHTLFVDFSSDEERKEALGDLLKQFPLATVRQGRD